MLYLSEADNWNRKPNSQSTYLNPRSSSSSPPKEATMRKRTLYVWGVAILCFVVLMIVTPAIPQSQEYHKFADQREFFGIPNTLNVISNFPFLVIGVIGLVLCFYKNYFKFSLQGELWGWTCFFIGVAAVGVGSSYYHLDPNDARLVWDRLPMTIAFTSIMAIFIIERIDEQKGTISIIPLLLAGVVSILYWRQAFCMSSLFCSGEMIWLLILKRVGFLSFYMLTSLVRDQGELNINHWVDNRYVLLQILCCRFFDDLRPYAVVQFVPCIVIPLMAILLPPMYTHSTYWLWAAAFYLLAKVEEAEDKVIYKWTHHIVSGHTLKHLCAAMVPVFLTLMLAKRTTETNRYYSCLYPPLASKILNFFCVITAIKAFTLAKQFQGVNLIGVGNATPSSSNQSRMEHYLACCESVVCDGQWISLLKTWKVSWTKVNENGTRVESGEYVYTRVQPEDSH
ncbi:hypothetical protein CXB51_035531 [Gossypium anomalum]|uniref:Ceramidase n=1 Tax=Gossypium anomalum TaxID=47600 RepID=A0A8J5XRC3_9ROSI|nr:hypothetical protein CXB51_035531 [Gossypium anomalum]